MLNYDARVSKILIQLFFVCDALCCVINVTVVIYVYPILCIFNSSTWQIFLAVINTASVGSITRPVGQGRPTDVPGKSSYVSRL